MPLRGPAQVLAEQAAVLSVSAADERSTQVTIPREQPLAVGGRSEEANAVAVGKILRGPNVPLSTLSGTMLLVRAIHRRRLSVVHASNCGSR